MGVVKKVFKKVGSLFGIGGSSSSTPTVQQVATDPTPTAVQDVSGDTAGANAATDAKKKKRRGFASTQTTIMSDETSGKDTLGEGDNNV